MKELILIVDDSPTNLKLIKILLNLEGYDVRTAVNADEVLDTLLVVQPSLILMDLQLPGMDGLTLTQEIKANPKYKNIIIVAVTAYAMKGDKELFLSSGCSHYLSKPYTKDDLMNLVMSILQEKYAC